MDTPRLWTIDELMAAPVPPPARLTDAELDRLDELDRLADPGPWLAVIDLGPGYTPEDGVQFGGKQDFGGLSVRFEATPYDRAATVRLLAAMRNALRGLLAEVRAARRECLCGGRCKH
jgi:hypothetical protein